MIRKDLLTLFFLIPGIYLMAIMSVGCAQIGSPTGGPMDTIPPKLVKASPPNPNTGFKGNKITLTFDEYIDVTEVQTNVLVSPFPKNNPEVSFKLRTVTVKLKDSLLPNTTYSIQFGKAIRDNHEGNPFDDFTYVFSTGDTIDSLRISGKIILAETGKTDSTIIALLYKNSPDSAVQKRKPEYIARTNSSGNFNFTNLSPGKYKVYALKDGDGGKTYNSLTEDFAFYDQEIDAAASNGNIILYAYAQEKDTRGNTPTRTLTGTDKKLKYTTSLLGGSHDLLENIEITYNKKIRDLDPAKIILTDTNFTRIGTPVVTIDSTRKKVLLKNKWNAGTDYRLIITKEAATDSTNNQIAKTDTIRFKTKSESDYGNVILHFTNPDLSKNPVLQFIRGTEIVRSVPVTGKIWSDHFFLPGDYELRLLQDDNRNGVWDTGNYSKKLQPEKVITLDTRLSVKSNWDNERDIKW